MTAILRRLAPLRLISNARSEGSYEGPGKTTVSLLNKDPDSGILINSFSEFGFKLSNGVRSIGPIVLFPRSILSWKVAEPADVDLHSLSLFLVIEPKVDVLILGMGDKEDAKLPHSLILPLLRRGTAVEVLATEKAIGSFNFLNAEGRNVAAALIPPVNFTTDENDMYQSTRERKILEGNNDV